METVIRAIDNFNYLKLVSFKDFALWDVKRLVAERIASVFPIVSLGDYIKEENTKIRPALEPEKEHKILGVNNIDGIFDAYTQLGKEIKQPYKIMKEGFLAYNPYRINVGSIGLKTKEHNNDLISPAYVVFSCKNGLNPDFLFKLFKTDRFNKVIRDNTTGSVRQNLTIDILKTLEIPLPKPVEQEEILAEYNAKMQEAERLKMDVDTTYQRIQTELKKMLGLVVEVQSITKNKLLFVNFKDLSRWDTLFLSGGVPNIKSTKKTVRFSNVIKCLNSNYGNSIRVNSVNFPNNDYHYIGMEHIEKETGELIEMPVVKGKMIKSQTLNVPKNFFLYGKLRPYLNKFWINKTDFDDIICSSELLVFDIDRELVTEDFFKYILSSEIIQTQISDKTSGARMPRINEKVFMNLEFPLPSIDEQKEISKELDKLIADRKVKQMKVNELKEQAITDFESKIFKN